MNKRIRTSRAEISVAAVGGTLFVSPTVSAQGNAAADDDEDALQEIVVTGTRIRRDEYTSPSPSSVSTLMRADKSASRALQSCYFVHR